MELESNMTVVAKIRQRVAQFKLRRVEVMIVKVEAHQGSVSEYAQGNARADYLATIGSTGYGLPPSVRPAIPRLEGAFTSSLCMRCTAQWAAGNQSLRRKFRYIIKGNATKVASNNNPILSLNALKDFEQYLMDKNHPYVYVSDGRRLQEEIII